MTITILNPGVQSTVQAAPRRGLRHLGVPGAGPFDPVSLALANRLVGNHPAAPAIEVALGPLKASFEKSIAIALVGGEGRAEIDGEACERHRTLRAEKGSVLELAPLERGARTYLAIAGGVQCEESLGSASTYLPAGFGGHQGRALEAGDRIETAEIPEVAPIETPKELRADPSASVLRVLPSAEFEALSPEGRRSLFGPMKISADADRMGLRLKADRLAMAKGAGDLLSSPVSFGTVQCPEGGRPIILGPDAGTTGGYPRLLHVIAADLPLLGQLRPGAPVRFFEVSRDEAAEIARGRRRWLEGWLGEGWPYGLF